MATRNRNTTAAAIDTKLFDDLIKTFDVASSQGYPMVAQTYAEWAAEHDAPTFGSPAHATTFHGQFIKRCEALKRDDLVAKWEKMGSQKTRFRQAATVGFYYDPFAAATLTATKKQREVNKLNDKELNVSAVRQVALKAVMDVAGKEGVTADEVLKTIKTAPTEAAKQVAKSVTEKKAKVERFDIGLRAIKAISAIDAIKHGTSSAAPVSIYGADGTLHDADSLLTQCMITLVAVALADGMKIDAKSGKLENLSVGKVLGELDVAAAKRLSKEINPLTVEEEKEEEEEDADPQDVIEKSLDASKEPAVDIESFMATMAKQQEEVLRAMSAFKKMMGK